MVTVVHNLKREPTFTERTRVHNLQMRVNDLRKEIDLHEANAKKARSLGYENEAKNLESKLPRLRQALETAEHHLDVAATEEAKAQHDAVVEAEHARDLEEFYADEAAEQQARFEAWRKRKGSPRC